MDRIPDEIDGLGRTDERWRQNPVFDQSSYRFNTDSYFIWSRFDGHASLRDVILMVGLPLDRTLRVLRDLYDVGAVLRPGEDAMNAKTRRDRLARAATEPTELAILAQADARERAEAERKAAAPADTAVAHFDRSQLTAEEATAMAVDVELPDEIKLRVVSMRRKLANDDYFALFELDRENLDKQTLKRSYFRLSKEFHPDRYFGKRTGPFGPWLSEVFQAVTEGFQVLSNKRARERYLATLSDQPQAAAPTQTREEYAAELFERACAAELDGHTNEALKLFSAVTRLDRDIRYLSRAARCAAAAGALESARSYAQSAFEREPENPSFARLLAGVYQQLGQLDKAEDMLQRALAMKSENDKLAAEIRRDLAAVRAAMTNRE
jgi:tetratricopeptide (TPR) repeat protein